MTYVAGVKSTCYGEVGNKLATSPKLVANMLATSQRSYSENGLVKIGLNWAPRQFSALFLLFMSLQRTRCL